MEKMMKFRSALIFCLCLMFVAPISARIKPSAVKQKKETLYSLRKKISKQKKDISRMNVEMMSLEETLGKKNRRYLKVLQEEKEIERKIYSLQEDLNKQEIELKSKFKRTKKLLSSLIANSIEATGDSADLLSKRLMVQAISKKMQGFKFEMQKNQRMQEEISSLRERYSDYKRTEQDLSSLIGQLEEKKKGVTRDYMTKIDRKDAWQKQLDRLKISQRLQQKRKKMEGLFASPLKDFSGVDYKKNKGRIAYKFRGTSPVSATRKGKVLYTGTLSTYGKIVILDHEKETRSVIFGNFSPTISKGVQVKKGDVLGYTVNGEGELFFEVRKKNQIQNTILLMDRKFLSNNNHIKRNQPKI